ncbi:MAG: SMP-30/gluconolactonase/LRE family protein [Acidobacteria bacterium]|nr:SMP-30/gluconolactonase/LRE family protein [Acidobacteriota bacterium]
MWRLPLFLLLFAALSPAQTSYLIETAAGSDATANALPFDDPRGIAVDPSGNVFLSDTARHRVIRIAVSGEMSVVAGTGKPGFSGDGGPADSAELNQPYGLALDSLGNLYIADLQNARVRKVDLAGRIVTVAGGGANSVTSGLEATAVALKAPRNVAVDSAGSLFISDFLDHRVLRVALSTRVSVLAGTGSPGAALDSVIATAGTLSYPAGLHITPSGEVYVADSGNHAIRRVTGSIMTRIPIQDSAAFVHLPVGVCFDPSGNLYIASTGFDQVVQVNRSGVPSVLTHEVRDIACDGTGNTFVVSPNSARRLTSDGKNLTIAGAAVRFRGEGSSATTALLNSPMDVKTDASGAIYIADTANHRIRKISAGIITTIAGDGDAGFSGDNGPAATARLFRPQGIAIDAAGNVFIADTQNHRVRRISANGRIATIAGTGVPGFNGDSQLASEAQLHTPSAVAVDANGVLYIADTGNHRIRRLTASGYLLTIAGTSGRGFSGDGEAALSARLDTPVGLVFDTSGNLFIADQGNRRIRRISPLGTMSTVLANAGLPTGLAIDPQGSLVYSDAATNTVLASENGATPRLIAGRGERGFSGDGEAARDARLDGPSGLAIDKQGNLYIADRNNHRIRKVSAVQIAPPSLPPPVVEEAEMRLWHGAILEATAIAPGMLLTLQGTGIGPPSPMSGTVAANGALAATLGDTQVRIDGKPAPILYAQENLINVQAPYSIGSSSTVNVEVLRAGKTRAKITVAVKAYVPGIFTAGSGAGPANALNEDLTVNQSGNRAARGALLTFYATGDGLTEPALIEGKLADPPYPAPIAPLAVTIDGRPAEITAIGSAVTSPGVLQVTVRVPQQAASGPAALVLTVGGVPSQAGVTVFVR